MIRIALTTILFVLTSPCWSYEFIGFNNLMHSLYIGGSIGPDTADFSQHARFRNANSNVIDNDNLAAKGSFLSIFGGYKWHYQKFYLAGEVNANQSTLEYDSANIELINQTISHTAYKINNSYGISVLPGFLFSDMTLFYGRFGLNRGHFIATTTDSSLEHVSSMLNGFRFGVGVQQAVYSHIDIRFEFDRIRYQDESMFVTGDGFTKQTTISPTTNQFEFAVVLSC